MRVNEDCERALTKQIAFHENPLLNMAQIGALAAIGSESRQARKGATVVVDLRAGMSLRRATLF